MTLGCTATEYCPQNNVTRLQMAAFMNRLGNALTPTIVTQFGPTGAIDLDLGRLAFDPGATPGLRYEGSARLRSGRWACPTAPGAGRRSCTRSAPA